MYAEREVRPGTLSRLVRPTGDTVSGDEKPVEVTIVPAPLAHDARDKFTNTCIRCYSKLKPGPQAVIVVDETPGGYRGTTTGGI